MPTETQQSRDNQNMWVNRIGAFAMSIALMVSSWFLNQAWDRINTVEKDVDQLKLEQAATGGNRFTSGDWVANKALLDSDRLAMDRRIMRLEETFTATKDSLTRIETAVNKHVDTTK